MTQREQFDRFLKSLTASFQKSGRTGRPASCERGTVMETAFETSSEMSDALAASLMIKAKTSPSLYAGLALWKVWSAQHWSSSADRHKGDTLQSIRAAMCGRLGLSAQPGADHPPEPGAHRVAGLSAIRNHGKEGRNNDPPTNPILLLIRIRVRGRGV